MGILKKVGKAAKNIVKSPIGKLGLIAGAIALGQPELALGELGGLGAAGYEGLASAGLSGSAGFSSSLFGGGALEGLGVLGYEGLSSAGLSGAADFVSPFAGGEGLNWNNIFNTARSFGSNIFSNNLTQPTGNPSGGGGNNWGNALSTMTSLGSGIYGMTLADQQRKLAEEQAKLIRSSTSAADPWGTSGGRGMSAQQLIQLNSDPRSAMLTDPRFAAMVQAAQRTTAPYGQNSGAMNVAGAQAGGNWYTQRMAELSGLAGTGNAGIPGQGAVNAGSLTLTGANEANTLAGRSLADIGFGVNTATGGGAMANIPPAVRIWLQSQGVRV